MSIETLKQRLSWLEQLCQPGSKITLDGIAQPYPGPTPELLQARDQLRREVQIANLLEALEAIQTLAETPINPAMDLKIVATQAREAIAKAGGVK
jgi:hypothetical protein